MHTASIIKTRAQSANTDAQIARTQTQQKTEADTRGGKLKLYKGAGEANALEATAGSSAGEASASKSWRIKCRSIMSIRSNDRSTWSNSSRSSIEIQQHYLHYQQHHLTCMDKVITLIKKTQ
jgi:hypothetical protein